MRESETNAVLNRAVQTMRYGHVDSLLHIRRVDRDLGAPRPEDQQVDALYAW